MIEMEDVMEISKTFATILLLFFLTACSLNAVEPSTPIETPSEPEPSQEDDLPSPSPTTNLAPETTSKVKPTPTKASTEAADLVVEKADDYSSPTPGFSKPVLIDDVVFEGVDGLQIQGTLYTPGETGPMPGVILLHMLGSNRQVWADNQFAQNLAKEGYITLSVDMRGHGQTGGDADWKLALEDIARIWLAFTDLDSVDPQQTALVGASIGANIALATSANQPQIKTVVLLSPGLDYRGVTTEDMMMNYDERSLLIVASEEDGYAADSSRVLADLAKGDVFLEIYEGAGHGTRMFSAEPRLAELILDWLAQNLQNRS